MSDQNNATKRVPFEITVDEPLDFEAIAVTKFITSTELAKAASELFKGVFADVEGCIFEAGNGGEPTLSIIFNHGDYSGSNLPVGCERIGGKQTGSNILDKTRNRDRQLKEGDRYYLTEDGKDAVISLLSPRYYNNGNPNWKIICTEWTERSATNYYTNVQNPQYTKVNFIDLRKICGLLYGTKIDDDHVDYDVKIASVMNPGGYPGMTNNSVYMLNITRASSKEVEKTYTKLGFGAIGSSIVR